ncbi:MAG: hypothetical protein K9G33_01375 [Sneathiella sp.]|nr:hypothetical protein [Sneathiella sp.]
MASAVWPTWAAAEEANWRVTGCAGVVEEKLGKMDLGDLRVAEVTYIVSSRGTVASEGSERLSGWVSFENCKGNLTVRLSETCGITEVYTSGQCYIKDVPNY